MASYQENKRSMDELFGGTSVTPDREEDFYLDKNVTLKKDDLKEGANLAKIRRYMSGRKGVAYKTKDVEETVDDFVQHLRYFNANSVSTTGELRFINKADDNMKKAARDAYQLYDQLGNVFQNDGAMGAVDGVKDYIFAAAKDPTNYIGLITGGVGRLLAGSYTIAGKKIVLDAVKRAGLQAARDGANATQIRKAAEKAGMQAARRAAKAGLSKNQSKKAAEKVTQEVTKQGRKKVALDAMKAKQKERFDKASGIALKTTIGADAGFAMLQDSLAQKTLMEAGAQEQYSKTQTAFSSLLGGVAGAAQLGFGKFRGVSGLEEPTDTMGDIAKTVIESNSAILSRTDGKKVTKQILKDVEDWNTKVERGYKLETANMPSDLFYNIILGEDGKGGLAKLMHDRGMKIHSNKLTADVVTNVVRFLPEEDLVKINKAMGKYTELTLGEVADTKRINLRDLIAKNTSESAKTLNVLSQMKRIVNSGIVAAGDKTKRTLEDDIAEATKEVDQMDKSQPLKYGQSVWKRLLVSSPATTMINVAGFAQYYVGQSMADLFNFGMLSFKALSQSTYDTAAARETMRQARAYTQVQSQKFRNLLDPYTTHDAYMRFLSETNNEVVRNKLFATMSGGVEVQADRFGINPDSKLFRNIEAGANAASNISGVRIQDSFTKSQMFMTEMDKYMRLNKKMTLREAIERGEEPDLEVIQGALDSTLKSVFSKDYTTTEQPELLRTAAKMAETFSNTPGFGTLLPFGRFFNNVIATAYQWSPLAAPQNFYKFARNLYKQEPNVTDREAFARMLVGTSALGLSMEFDNERREKGLDVYEVDVGGGTIVDAKNTYPFSLWLAAGRVLNTMRNGEQVSEDLQREIGTQLAVGQLARDTQFANDINNMLDVLTNVDIDKRAASIDGLYKVTGNFVAGFTRPLDVLNKAVGFATGTDTAKDVRQAEGINTFSQTATKYVDNIIEAFIDKTDTITGEELSVATRQGEVYDANPFARMFGLTIKPSKTATETVYSMADMAPWKASERTNIPAYDKIFNGMLAPMLELYTQDLLNNPRFQDATIKQKRGMLKKRLSEVKARVRESMERGYAGYEGSVLNKATSLTRRFSKETRREAMKMLRQDYGITGQLEDLSFRELELFTRYAQFIKDAEDEVGKL
jgi:hypothetical protein